MPASYYPRRKPQPTPAFKHKDFTARPRTRKLPDIKRQQEPAAPSRKRSLSNDTISALLPPTKRLAVDPTNDAYNPKSKSLQLLDLPLEIQQLILQNLFSGPWTVKDESPYNDKPRIKRTFSFDTAPFLVNRHFSQEAQRTIARSRLGTYVSSVAYIDLAPRFFDPGIVKFLTEDINFLNSGSVKALRRRFPRLSKITCTSMSEILVETRDEIQRHRLLRRLEGKHDGDIARCAGKEYVQKIVKERGLELVRGVAVSWVLSIKLENLRPRGVEDFFDHCVLSIEFEVDNDDCRVVKRSLKDTCRGINIALCIAIGVLKFEAES